MGNISSNKTDEDLIVIQNKDNQRDQPNESKQKNTHSQVQIMCQQLMSKGFDAEISMITATKYPNDLQKAINYVLDQNHTANIAAKSANASYSINFDSSF